MKNKIYPCLWFNGNAKEAANFYSSVFTDTVVTADTPLVATFESSGQKFMCLNGGPDFSFNPSVSFFVVYENLQELETAWSLLVQDGSVLMALNKYEWSEKYGWLQDRYGVNWQLSFGKLSEVGQKFTPTLMFTGNQHGKAEQAINFYTSVFNNSSITGVLKYSATDHDVEGTVKHAQFTLENHVFMAMDSSMSKEFSFNEAISLVVECKQQQEIDYYWNKLTEGGSEGRCGWLKDRFGVSWQIVPAILGELMSDPARSGNVLKAFMKMKKFDIEELLAAS
ncbi:MAG TPA: VOC family protein [Chitinophagaceae bacterium]|nr:VOC family protein [Chitinophagaceae bacterium]